MTIDLRDPLAPSTDAAAELRVLDAVPPTAPARHRPSHQHQVLALTLLAGAAAALFSDAAPAGIAFADGIYRGLFASLVVWAASRARRWTWTHLAGISTIVSAVMLWQVIALIALLSSLYARRSRIRRQLTGAAIALASLPGLMSQGEGPLWRLSGGHLDDPFGLSAVIAIIASGPIFRSAWRTLSRRKRRQLRDRTRRGLAAAVGVIGLSLLVCVIAVPSMMRGLRETQVAADQAEQGNLVEAAAQFEAANTSWSRANRIVAGPWMVPARLVPVLGQHVRAAQVASGQASALTSSASMVATRVDPDRLVVDGAINLDEVDRITPAVDAFAATTQRAADRIEEVLVPWLLPPIAERIDRANEVLVPASGVINAGAEALHVGTELLGGTSPSNILIMVATPAEARGTGGFVGNWALIEANDGRVRVVEQYRTRQLNELLEAENAVLRSSAEYEARYGRFAVERHIQDVTLSPDFPSVAPVAADLFAQATGSSVDAVLLIDPLVIEKLLQFSGPLDRVGTTPLSRANAADELLVEQYIRFGDDERSREAELGSLTTALVESLFKSPPDPLDFARELAPLADQNRIALWLDGDNDSLIVERLGLDGAFPRPETDLLAIVHQNAGQNKIDTFLDRTVNISTVVDEERSVVSHDVTITLDNGAPSDGLPDAILASNDQGFEPGTNRMILSVYSALPLTHARINGVDVGAESQVEFGANVYSFVVAIGAGDFATVELSLEGSVPMSADYAVTLGAQPLAEPDQMSWHVMSANGRRISGPEGWSSHSDGVRWSGGLDRDSDVVFTLG